MDEKLSAFFGKKCASRKEMLNDIWNHIQSHHLMHKNMVRVDDALKEILSCGEREYVAVEDIAYALKELCSAE